MELIRHFDAETFARSLEDWDWLAKRERRQKLQPIAASLFGDVFLQGKTGVWFLDMLEGSLTMNWPDARTLQAELNTGEGQDRYLFSGIATAADAKGIVPGPTQVLSFRVLPVLGGLISADNVGTADFVVASSLAGQIHRQVKDLPPGARVAGINFAN